MEKRALSEEKSFDLNEIIENEIQDESEKCCEIQNDCEKCCSYLPKKGRKKLIGLTIGILCTLVISVIVVSVHFYSRSNGK